MNLVDFHCHLSEAGGYAALDVEQRTLLGEARSSAVISMTNFPSAWQAMAKDPPKQNVVWALGLHPGLRHSIQEVERFVECAPRAEVIGEVGLDYSRRSESDPKEQRRILDQILSLKIVRDRVVSIHSAGATGDIVATLEKHRIPAAVLHWFLGSDDEIERAIDIDTFFSVNERMVKSERGQRIISLLPPNRVLLETDAPYGIAKGGSTGPGNLQGVLRGLASVWMVDSVSAADLVIRNQQGLASRAQDVPAILRRN